MSCNTPKPFNEDYRLSVLRQTGILDTPPEAVYDSFTDLAAGYFKTKIALVSIVDVDRQWFKSRVGMSVTETERTGSFCSHAITKKEVSVILDAAADPRFSDNPFVTGPPHIRFYAGAPIIVDGAAIGSFCIIDSSPRQEMSAADQEYLAQLASLVSFELDARRKSKQSAMEIQALMEKNAEITANMEAAKSRFLALLNHELRTPLNAIMGFAELIKDEVAGPIGAADYRDYAREIHESGARLQDMIERLLSFSNVARGQISVHETEFDADHLVKQCCSEMSGVAAKRGVTLVPGPSSAMRLLTDANNCRSIIRQLLDNAIKFSSTGGTVTLGVENHDGSAAYVITDEGSGLKGKDLTLLFEPFRQGDDGYTRRHEGVGLGLPLAQRLASVLGGSIALESRPEGGAVASFTLPDYAVLARPAAEGLRANG